MRPIESVEKSLPEKRKALLHALREHRWNVLGIDDADANWALDQTWLIESTREGKGTAMTLWFFKYAGVHDGIDRVVATPANAPAPNPYGGEPSIEFDGRQFEKQLESFMAALHEHRIKSSVVFETLITTTDGQRWRQRWHPPGASPEGKRNGSAGLCVTGDGQVVLISSNNRTWDLPGGRPEGDEDWEQTLRREVLEEACATVEQARLLGYAQGCHVDGPEAGRWMVRSIWLARVTLHPWQPAFETTDRKLVPFEQAVTVLQPKFRPLWDRMFDDARRVMTAM